MKVNFLLKIKLEFYRFFELKLTLSQKNFTKEIEYLKLDAWTLMDLKTNFSKGNNWFFSSD